MMPPLAAADLYRPLLALSAPLASTAEGCLGVRSSGAAVGLERVGGKRPDTVQHVVGERNEQSSSVTSAVDEDWVLAAQPERNGIKIAPIPRKMS
jgi:hypothetical protein